MTGIDASQGPTVLIENSIIEHNDALAANANGGCVATVNQGELTIDDTILRNCKSDGKGGLLSLEGDFDVTIQYSSLYKGETVDEGGGVYVGLNSGSGAEFENSTISTNKATDSLAKGGGVSLVGGTLNLLFCTVASNELPNVLPVSTRVGTQLAVESGSLDMSGTVLDDDRLSTPNGDVCDVTISATDSLASDSSCGISTGSPNLGAMEYGTSTFYHVPQSGSPLINGAGTTCPGSNDDQRHSARGSTCWIGSYED